LRKDFCSEFREVRLAAERTLSVLAGESPGDTKDI
jgi:hypothetical protein